MTGRALPAIVTLVLAWFAAGFASAAYALHPKPFIHGPTDLGSTPAVIPIGGLNGFSHILPVDHAMIAYPDPANGGMDEFLVYAMGDGELVMVLRETSDDIPDPDYELYVRHSFHLTSQYAHMYSVTPGLQAYLDSVPGAWIEFGDTAFLFPGQLGASEPLTITAGEVLGTTKSYGHAWDVGVIDSRQRSGRFANPERYPDLELLEILGVELEHPPFRGSRTLNAACFLDYMPEPLRQQWAALLASVPPACGRAGWDLPLRLRGAWFNPDIDAAPPEALFELEQAAVSIVPWNLAPDTHVNIAIGHGSDFSAFDPDDNLDSIHEDFVVAIDPDPAAVVNPDPASVSFQTGTVCYDLRFDVGGMVGYHALFLRLQPPAGLDWLLQLLLGQNPQQLDMQLVSDNFVSPACETLMLSPPENYPVSYIR